jgi:hypothetical protein
MNIKTVWTALALAAAFALGWMAHDLQSQPTPRRAQRLYSVNRIDSVSIPLTDAIQSLQEKPNR